MSFDESYKRDTVEAAPAMGEQRCKAAPVKPRTLMGQWEPIVMDHLGMGELEDKIEPTIEPEMKRKSDTFGNEFDVNFMSINE